MPNKNDIIKKAIAGGIVGGALGALFTGKSRGALASMIAGAAIGASLEALDKAVDTGIPVLFEEDGYMYRLYPDGSQELVRKIEPQKIKIPQNFSLE